MYITLNDILKNASYKFNKYTNTDIVIDAIRAINEASHLTRNDGLLALEDAFGKGISKTLMDDIAFGVMLVVDGTEPELVAEILVNDYWANKYNGNHALKQYILIRGLLSIQQGDNPRVIEEILLSTLPTELREECRAKLEEDNLKRKEINEKCNLQWFREEYKPILSEDDEVVALVNEFEAAIKCLNEDSMLRL